uniref:Uracil phosphoribosyltransferase n=1 Tax=Podoviridae sp. ctiuS14 TaxID=2827620 RepID=A0A8S5LM83_9CAUD|nr:MAG TPA: uracil phosphoribosyltransferase [Podoviridae sp. ctiuS14]
MEIINFSDQNSIVNQYMAEIRDKEYQRNRLLFRNNVMRIGEFEAFEISKTLQYETKEILTPLGVSKVNIPTDKIVLATIFRAGLPFHNGFLNIFKGKTNV